MPESPESGPAAHLPAALPADRAADALAAGRTIALRPEEWSNPALRKELPSIIAAASGPTEPPRHERPKFGKYEVLGEIAQGGMSTVYLARDPVLDRLVALKVLLHIGSTDAGNLARERLLREARAMANLAHPHIVRMYDVVEGRDGLGLAMEWIDGLTLAQLLRKLPPQETPQDLATIAAALGSSQVEERDTSPTRWLVRSLRDVALALHHVHAAGLLHLDVKPSNILLRRDGTALLADFGVVREIDLLQSRTGTFTGTPIYAAPEQFLRKASSYRAATDVYGLGITLYEALARAQPVQEGSLATMLRQLETGRVPPLASRCRVPSDLANIVHKAIHPEPHRRYQTAAEFAEDLTAFLANRPVSAHRPDRAERLRRWLRDEPWKALAAGLLLATVPVVGGLGWKVLADRPKLAQLRAEDLRRQAEQLVHLGTQAMFGQPFDRATPQELLRRAHTLDPEAVLPLGMWGIASRFEPNPELELALRRHVAGPAPHPFLTALAQRSREGRRTFTTEERQRLGASGDADSLVLLAIEELNWRAMGHPVMGADWEQALLEKAHGLVREQNPLVVGVLAMLNGPGRRGPGRGDPARYERYSTALATIWPDDIHVQLWLYLAGSQRDKGAANRLLEDLSRRFPGHPEILRRQIAAAIARHDWQAAEVLLMELPSSERFAQWAQLLIAELRGERSAITAAARQFLADERFELGWRTSMVYPSIPEEARPCLASWAARPHPSPNHIFAMLVAIQTPEDFALLELAIRKAIALRMPLRTEVQMLYLFGQRCGDVGRAASLLSSIEGHESLEASIIPSATTLLARGQRWREAVTIGDHHFAALTAADERRMTSSALAIAHARLGDRAAATKYVDIHLELAPRGGHFEVHLERAALLLHEPERLADAQRILDDLDRMLAAKDEPRQPYYQLVRSRAARLAGDTASALALLQAADAELRARFAALPQRPKRAEWSAPRDLAEQIAAGLAELADAAAAPAAARAGDKR